jgi:hypothetical protein
VTSEDRIDLESSPLTAQMVAQMHGLEVSGQALPPQTLIQFRERLKAASTDAVLSYLSNICLHSHTPADQDCETYWALVERLQQEASAPVFNALAKWTESAQPALRLAGINGLGQLGWPVSHKNDCPPFARETAPIVERLLSDKSEVIVAATLAAAGHLGFEDITSLVRFIDSPSENLRWMLAFALEKRTEPLARTLLIELSQDESPCVRDWATFALGSRCEIDTPEIREALVARLVDPEPEPRVEAIKGLALRQDRRALPALMQELAADEIDPDLFDAAIQLPDARHLPHLKRHRAKTANIGTKLLIEKAMTACRAHQK